MKTNTFETKTLSLMVGLAGCAIAISPLQNEYKILTSATASIVCAVASIEETKAKQKQKIGSTKFQQDLEFGLLKLSNEQHTLEQDLVAIAQLRQELENEKATLADMLRLAEDASIAEMQIRENQTNAVISDRRKIAAARLRSLKSKTWKHRRHMTENLASQFEEEMNQLWELATKASAKAEVDLARRIQRIKEEEKANGLDSIAALKQLFEDCQQQLLELRMKGEADQSEDLKEGQKMLATFAASQVKQIEGSAQSALIDGLREAVSIIAYLEVELEKSGETIYELQGKLAAIAKASYCPYESRHGTKANEFIRFVDENFKIKLIWLSSLMLTGDCLQIDFEFHDSEDKLKAIAKLQKPQAIEAIGVRFGNEGIIVQANPIDHCWRATIPANEGYLGSDDSYLSPITREADDIEQALRSQMDFAGMEEYMSNFIPVVVSSPEKQVSQQELTMISYFMFWRAAVSSSPNIASIPGLLKAVYGVTEAEGRVKDSKLGESLWTRLDRLQPTLRKEYGDLILEGV